MVAWCPECQAEVELMRSEDASPAQLLGGLRRGLLHVCQGPRNSTQICLPSLMHVSQPSQQVQQPNIPERRLNEEGEEQ
jgi:hypothetical protein